MDFQDFHPVIKDYLKHNKHITFTPDYNIQPKTYIPNMKLNDRFSVAGVQYSDYQKIKPNLIKIGTKVIAKLEPNNPHDKLAIALYIGQHRIGYVPKGNLKMALHRQRAFGVKFDFKIVAINKNNPTWGLFTVEVTGDKDPNVELTKESGSIPFNSSKAMTVTDHGDSDDLDPAYNY